MTAQPNRDWLLLGAAVVGPVLVTVAYLVFSSMINDVAPVEGYARAERDRQMYGVYVAALAVLVVSGTWASRSSTFKLAFALIGAFVSLFAMFIAFFGQMAP